MNTARPAATEIAETLAAVVEDREALAAIVEDREALAVVVEDADVPPHEPSAPARTAAAVAVSTRARV